MLKRQACAKFQSQIFDDSEVIQILKVVRWHFCQVYMNMFLFFFFSSYEPSGSQGELIVYPCSVVRHRCCRCRRCSHFSIIFMRGSRNFHDRGSNENGNFWSQTRGGGGSNPQKIPKLPFLGKIFKFHGGGSGPPVPPPSGSAHDLLL